MKTGKPVSPYEGDIMIVDDEAANVELLMEILSGTGYRIRTASDGNLALRSAQVMPPALVLLDIKMPGMDGYEVCRRLKENEKTCSIPVIFISVLGEDREKAKAFQVGGVDYVTRPFQPQEVLARIETHLTLWKVQQELELRNAELETWNLVLAEEIAERKHAQQDLAVEKERLAVTLRSIGDGVITTDTQGTVVSLNKVAETLTGWTEGEAVGRPLEEVFRIINEQTRQPCENPVQKVLETGQVVGLANHTLLISRHGTERILADSGAPIRAEDGEVLGVVLVFKDVTEQAKAEEALRQSEERFRSLFETAQDSIYVLDAEGERAGRIIQSNPAAAEMHGYTLEELLTLRISDLDTPESAAKVPERLARLLRGERLREEATHRRKDGTVFPVETSAGLLDLGGHKCIMAIDRDISDRKRTEELLRLAGERYRRLFEYAPVMYVITRNERGVPYISDCNEFFLRTVGWPREDVVGKPLADFYSPESPTALLEGGGCALALRGQFLMGERQLVTRDGRLVPTLLYTGTEEDSSGRVVGTRSTFVDITERKKAEEALRASEEKFRNLFNNAEVGMFRTRLDGSEILDMNEKFLKIFGCTREEMQGKPSVIHWAEPLERKAMVRRLQTDGRVTDFECKIFNKQGEVRNCVKSLRLYRDDGVLEGSISDVTEHKRAQEALRISEERYRRVFDNAAVGIDLVDQDGRFMQVNRSLAQMLGCSEEDLLNLTIFDITHPEDVADSRSRYQELIRAETDTYRFEKRYIRKDGEVVWADVSVSAIRGPDGVYEATIAVISDITRRKRAEEQLAESEERFRLAFENANIGVCMVDAQGRLLRVNDQLCEIWGYNRSELEGMTVNDITHPEDQELGRRFIERASSGEVERDEFEKRYIHKNGRVVWGKVSSSLVRDEQGNPLYFISHVQDVTERRRAEHVERRLVTAIDQATEGVLITDPHGTIQYVNPGLEQMTGYGREELIGRTPRILKSGEHDTQFYRRLWDTIKAGKTWTGRFTNRRKDGRLYYEDATISPVKDPSGKIVNFVAVKRDITEHLEISKQLLQAQKMEAIGTLAGGVAHDFNNLLTVVLGYSELILNDEDFPASYTPDLQKIAESARRGAELVQRLLTFGRKTDVKPLRLNLNRRIHEVRKMLERTLPKMIKIQLVPARDLAAIHADPVQMDQILMNLAVNARDAMPDGGRLVFETANVFLDEEYAASHLKVEPGLYVCLSVTDTGSGMDRDTLEHLFEPFYTTKETGKGTGLGLAMVYGIVQQHEGHIRCSSEPGHGTTFKIYFPALVDDEEPQETALRAVPRGGSETVLLVDDEELIRDLGSKILTKVGYKVITASNGKEALDVYQRERDEISLVILDLIMPEMGGKQCLEGLLSLDPSVKVVIASGYSADGPTREALAAGAKGFANKPYDIWQVLQVVREVLDEE